MPRDAEHTTLTYREIDGRSATKAEWDHIDEIFAARGWMSLCRETTLKIILAEDEAIGGIIVLQFIPHLGPLWVRPSLRGSDVTQELTNRMREFLVVNEARGVVIVADNPITQRMCEEAKMVKVASPVYVLQGAEV